MDQALVDFKGARQTMFATLYGKALDNRSPTSILHDENAEKVLRRIGFDFSTTGMNATSAHGVAWRAKQLDDWTRAFLIDDQATTVLHLGCGLDARVQRVDPGPSVRWCDVDYPDVIALRRRLLPRSTGDYLTIGASVLADTWLEQIPNDRPTVAVLEGLTMYLREAQGKQLIQRIAQRFPCGQLLFDCYGPVGIWMQKRVTAVRNAGATLHWGISNPNEIEQWHDGLRCINALRFVDMPGLEHLPRRGRLIMRTFAHLPGFRDIGRVLRYQF